MAFENLILHDKGFCRTITINRPAVHNALNRRVLCELSTAVDDVDANKNIRCLVITGAGEKSFVAGADIAEMKNMSVMDALSFSSLGHAVFDKISALRIPVIAAANGYALGGGLELALACDFILAAENASFGLVETKLALIPGFGGIGRLSKRVGCAKAKELVFLGAQINAMEAQRIGLVNGVASDDVVEVARSMADKIAQRGPFAVSFAKRLLDDADTLPIDEINAKEKLAFAMMFASKDHDEGILAFLEKRSPIFSGQ